VSERTLSAALVLLCAGLISPAAIAATHAERTLSPKALYQALLKVPRGSTALPDGYQSPTLGPITPSPTAKRHHVLGEIAIDVTKSGTAGARILYIVFPTRADALADWNEGARRLPAKRLTPPGFVPKPSAMFNAPVTAKNSAGKTVSFGTTTLAYMSGNLIVEVDTSSTSSTVRGDIVGTVALAQFAGSHLVSVTGPAAPVAPIAPIA
jgi:hypothetical protein